jgi:hypothetical protein
MHLTEQMSLLAKSEKTKDLETVSNDFNNFFLTITENLNSHQMGNENALSFLKDAFPKKSLLSKSFQPMKLRLRI